MDAAAKRGSGINLGFLAPLTPFRHYVMGEESMERAATAEETAQDQGADQGGGRRGRVRLHHHHRRRSISATRDVRSPAATRAATSSRPTPTRCKELGRGAMELALTKSVSILDEEEYEFLDFLLTESGRPVTWLAAAQSRRHARSRVRKLCARPSL